MKKFMIFVLMLSMPFQSFTYAGEDTVSCYAVERAVDAFREQLKIKDSEKEKLETEVEDHRIHSASYLAGLFGLNAFAIILAFSKTKIDPVILFSTNVFGSLALFQLMRHEDKKSEQTDKKITSDIEPLRKEILAKIDRYSYMLKNDQCEEVLRELGYQKVSEDKNEKLSLNSEKITHADSSSDIHSYRNTQSRGTAVKR